MGKQKSKIASFDEHREKALIGEAFLRDAKRDPETWARLKALLEEHVTDERDRELLRARGWL